MEEKANKEEETIHLKVKSQVQSFDSGQRRSLLQDQAHNPAEEADG